MSRIEALAARTGGMTDETVMPANAAIQIQVTRPTIRPNSAVLTTSSGCSAAAMSCTNGLPMSSLTSATSKIPALLSGSIHRSMADSPPANVSTVSTENAATEPISST